MKRLFCLQAKKTASLLYTRTRYQVNNIDVVVSLWIFPTMPFQYVSSPRGHAAATRPPHTEAQGVVGERTGPNANSRVLQPSQIEKKSAFKIKGIPEGKYPLLVSMIGPCFAHLQSGALPPTGASKWHSTEGGPKQTHKLA